MHYRGEFTFLFMLQLAQEAEIMMNNLIPYLKHQNGEKILRYVIEEAKQEAEKDGQNKENKRVICATDEFLEKELEDNIGLIDTQSYLEVRKKEMEEAQLQRIAVLTNPKQKLDQLKYETQEKVQALTNKVVAAFFNEDDLVAILEESAVAALIVK